MEELKEADMCHKGGELHPSYGADTSPPLHYITLLTTVGKLQMETDCGNFSLQNQRYTGSWTLPATVGIGRYR